MVKQREPNAQERREEASCFMQFLEHSGSKLSHCLLLHHNTVSSRKIISYHSIVSSSLTMWGHSGTLEYHFMQITWIFRSIWPSLGPPKNFGENRSESEKVKAKKFGIRSEQQMVTEGQWERERRDREKRKERRETDREKRETDREKRETDRERRGRVDALRQPLSLPFLSVYDPWVQTVWLGLGSLPGVLESALTTWIHSQFQDMGFYFWIQRVKLMSFKEEIARKGLKDSLLDRIIYPLCYWMEDRVNTRESNFNELKGNILRMIQEHDGSNLKMISWPVFNLNLS